MWPDDIFTADWFGGTYWGRSPGAWPTPYYMAVEVLLSADAWAVQLAVEVLISAPPGPPPPATAGVVRWRMTLASDHSTGSDATPTVVACSPGGAWFTPAGPVSSAGDGWFALAATADDAAGGYPLLVYATATGADPEPAALHPPGGYTAAIPLAAWLGDAAADGWTPLAGAAAAFTVSLDGSPAAPGRGTVAEPGGAGAGNGFYLYSPTPGEAPAGGDLAIVASAAGAVDWSGEFRES